MWKIGIIAVAVYSNISRNTMFSPARTRICNNNLFENELDLANKLLFVTITQYVREKLFANVECSSAPYNSGGRGRARQQAGWQTHRPPPRCSHRLTSHTSCPDPPPQTCRVWGGSRWLCCVCVCVCVCVSVCMCVWRDARRSPHSWLLSVRVTVPDKTRQCPVLISHLI